MKRTGVARAPLRRGEKLRDKIEAQLAAIKRMPHWSGHSSKHPLSPILPTAE